MDEIDYRATKLCQFQIDDKTFPSSISQCFVQCAEANLLYILYQHSITILNADTGKSNEIKTEHTLLPLTTYDRSNPNPNLIICTDKGLFLNVGNDELISESFSLYAEAVFSINGIILAADKSGTITQFNGSKRWTTNRPENGFLGKIFRPPGVISLAANSKYVFALTNDSKFIKFDIADGQKLSTSTVNPSKLLAGKLLCDEEYCFLVLTDKNNSRLKVFDIVNNEQRFEITRPIITDIDINESAVLLLEGEELTLYDRNDGQVLSNYWLPVDDITYSGLDVNKNDIKPRHIQIRKDGMALFSTNSTVYLCRPILPYETLVLNTKRPNVDSKVSDILVAAMEFAKTISRHCFVEFDHYIKETSDPSISAYELVLKYINRKYDFQLPDEISINMIENLIKTLDIAPSFCESDTTPNSKFWRSAATQVVFTYSYICKCVYLILMFLTYQNQTTVYSQCIRTLSTLVHRYTQLSILVENETLPLEIFDNYCFDRTTFQRDLSRQLSYLIDFEKVSEILILNEQYTKVIEFLKTNRSPSKWYGLALLKLNKFDECVNYFLQNSIFLLNDRDLTADLFNALQFAHRDDLIIKIGIIDSVTNAPALFRANLNVRDFDSAFNCILTAEDPKIKCDMFRVFIRIISNNRKSQNLLNYPVASILAMFTNELCCYSIDTLLIAANFYNLIGDSTQCIQCLYICARTLLRDPTKDNLKLAHQYLVMVKSQLADHSSVIIDNTTNATVSYQKIKRMAARIDGCRLLKEPKDSLKTDYSKLLKIAAKKAQHVFSNLLSNATNDEIYEIIPYIVQKRLYEPMLKIIKVKCDEQEFLEKIIVTYFESNIVPPSFIIDVFAKSNVIKLIMLCQAARQKEILIDVINNLYNSENKEKYFYLVPLFKKINLPQDIIDCFTVQKP